MMFFFQELKSICWGSPTFMPEKGWSKGIKFNNPEEPNAFGLMLKDESCKPFMMVLQGLFLKNLIFSDSNAMTIPT